MLSSPWTEELRKTHAVSPDEEKIRRVQERLNNFMSKPPAESSKLEGAIAAVRDMRELYLNKEATAPQERNAEKEAEVVRLIQEGRIKAWLQPKRDASTEEIMGFEVLCRMEGDTGLLQPGQFMPHIPPEMKSEFEWSVIKEALSLLSEANLPDGVRMGVNVSASTLSDKNFFERLTKEAQDRGANLAALRIEILESEPILERRSIKDLIRECATSGVDFSLDDFCAGDSQPGDLKDFEVKEIKIDRELVWMLDGPEKEKAERMIAGVLDWATARGAKVAAEGVENAYQAKRLNEMGISCQQGYYWNKPMPASEALALLSQRRGEDDAPNRSPHMTM